jgi:hypothetical protein
MKIDSKMLLSFPVSAMIFFLIILTGCSVNSEYLAKMQEKIHAFQSLLNNRSFDNSITELRNKKDKALCENSYITFTYNDGITYYQKLVLPGGSEVK